ncbi:MAG TPA: hypothetical protein VFQ77_11570 [Pseudonocardiaceae bacterium]|jgi:hypothetical protein|nr:hypothetical protein [Pseudonocardiaceae bacterium]
MDATGPLARRFPLVARLRPACTPLPQRVADLCDRARKAERDSDLAAAAAVHNLAALVASDCGLPNLARQWCHRQANLYLRACPLSAQAARHALEPLINLARLHIRDGQGERAFDLVDALYTAVCARTHATIDGVEIPAHLIHSREAHQEVRRWLWAVLLATGARALATAGHWQEACACLRDHKGIGRRMLDGRQVAVIAHATSGDTEEALALLDGTEHGEPWENAVTACLTMQCRSGSGTASLEPLLDHYRVLGTPAPGVAVFHTRLGLSFLDAIGIPGNPLAHRIATDLIGYTTAAQDGYAARDLLAHSGCNHLLTDTQTHELTGLVEACALGRGTFPATLLAALTTALASVDEVIARTVAGKRRAY